jgi:hypothetical protein
MILKIYRSSSCKYIQNNKCDYTIKVVHLKDTTSVNVNIQSSSFDESSFENEDTNELIEEFRTKLQEIGDSPSDTDTHDIYKYLYDKLVTSYKCKYECEIRSLEKQVEDSTHKYTIGEPLADGTFSKDQYFSSWYFDINDEPCSKIYLVHLFTWDNGCGCWNSSLPLSVFNNKKKALNFLKKCEDFSQKCRDVWNVYYAHLDTYELNTEMNTFEKINNN